MAINFFALNLFQGDGSTKQFTISFQNGYLKTADVLAQTTTDYVNFIDLPIQSVVGSLVTLVTAPEPGTIVVLRRSTQANLKLVDYSDGAILNEGNLDLSNDQNLNVAMEAFDNSTLSSVVAFGAVNTANTALSIAQTAGDTANGLFDTIQQANATAQAALEAANQANINSNSAAGTANSAYEIATGIADTVDDALETADAALAATANSLKRQVGTTTLDLYDDSNGLYMAKNGNAIFNISDGNANFTVPVLQNGIAYLLQNDSRVYKNLKTQLFGSTGTWPVPTGVTSVLIEAVGGGGGGGGGGGAATGATYPGAGGSSGAPGSWVTRIYPLNASIQTLEISVGAGGARGSRGGNTFPGGDGTAGSVTTVRINTTSGTTITTANGGAGGKGGGYSTGTTAPEPATFTSGQIPYWSGFGVTTGGPGQPAQTPMGSVNSTGGPMTVGNAGWGGALGISGTDATSSSNAAGAGGAGGGGAGKPNGSALIGGYGGNGGAGAVRLTWIE